MPDCTVFRFSPSLPLWLLLGLMWEVRVLYVRQADWDAEFSKYQLSPEFQKVNSKMTLDEFKFIYWCFPTVR